MPIEELFELDAELCDLFVSVGEQGLRVVHLLLELLHDVRIGHLLLKSRNLMLELGSATIRHQQFFLKLADFAVLGGDDLITLLSGSARS